MVTGKKLTANPTDDYVHQVFQRLKKLYGKTEIPLHYKEPYQLCVAVILSAQCTDARVNLVTPELFRQFPDAKSLADRPIETIEELIHSTGFYHNKARNIKGFCQSLVNDHGGVVPNTMKELVKMPGVGRKTANVVLQELYNVTDGFVVDTHVLRVSKRLGLSKSKDAIRVEKELMAVVPANYWIDLSLYLIFLGRQVCVARKPRCHECVLADICPSSTYHPSE